MAGGIGGALNGAFTSWGMVGAGIAKGAITGFVTGGVNAALNGTNVWNGALRGSLSGGLIGGAMGALEKLSIRNSDFDLPEDQNTGKYFRSEDELNEFIDDKIGNVGKIQSDFRTDISLASENNLPDGSYSFKNNFIYKLERGKLGIKGGSTEVSGGWFTSLKSRIYISPGIKGLYYSGTNVSQMAINHELLHAYHLSLGLSNSIYNRYSERATSAYSLAYSKAYNMSTLIPLYRSAIGTYPSSYSWRNLIGILNLGIR